MNQNTFTRREITRLHAPWLQHEHFPATKQACSSIDGLVTSDKRSLIKVVQELKRGRAFMDKQLAQLDSQLLAITEYLKGSSANMFPPHMVMYVEDASNVVTPLTATADGRRYWSPGNGAAVAGAFSGISTSKLEQLTPALIEEDLNSDTPCTSIGLWKYLYAYSFFKTITPEDIEQALLLEDPNAFLGDFESSDEEQVSAVAGLKYEQPNDDVSLKKSQNMDDFLKERLIASLCALGSPSSIQEDKGATNSQPDNEDKFVKGETKLEAGTDMSSLAFAESWNPKGITHALCKVELLEGGCKTFAKICSSSRRDDEVSLAISSLQRQLCSCTEQTNETKRKLRKIMDRTTPWLSHEEEKEETIIKQYFTMLQKNKELARKKKLREKKLQRKQALRLGRGGGSGKPLFAASSDKVRCHGPTKSLDT